MPTSTTDAPTRWAWLAAFIALLAVAVVAALCLGARNVPPVEVLRAFTAHAGTDDHVVVRDLRLPRMLLGVLVGAALGVAGTLVQTLTRNPLAEPGILGVGAGAAFGIVVAGVVAGVTSQGGQLAAALAGAAGATVLVHAVGRRSPAQLLLAGVALTAVLSGLSLGARLVRPDVFDAYRVWSVGTLAGREQAPLALPVVALVVALAVALLLARPLGAMALGDGVARSLGVDVRLTRVLVVGAVTVLAGAATAIAGPITFVGLVVPHLARRAGDGSVGWLMAHALVLGPALLLAADVVARLVLPRGEVPVAVVTAFIGGPVLAWVVRRHGAVAM